VLRRCVRHSAPPKLRFFRRTAALLPALCWVALSLLLPTTAAAVPPIDPATGTGPWEQVQQSHNITVHRRAVAGSNLHEFRGVGIIEAPIAVVLAVLDDAEHRLEWMKEARANTRIRNLDPYTELFYSRTAAPWPVADRDVVLKSHTEFDAAARQVRIEIESTTDATWPEQKGVVRMPFLRGHWYLWPEHDGAWTRAEYQVHANPAGMLTDFLINQVSKKIPYDTMLNMQKQVKRHPAEYGKFEAQLLTLPAYRTIVGTATAKTPDAAPSPTAAPAPAAAPSNPGS
jgi:hypothetical protein